MIEDGVKFAALMAGQPPVQTWVAPRRLDYQLSEADFSDENDLDEYEVGSAAIFNTVHPSAETR